jgi:nanoRNase/pAp phosphatase (c-di-AMP/oligoRNAs hydrolase)
MIQERLNQLIQAIGSSERVLILPHNNPDPDAIASAVALRYLLAEKFNVESHIAYQGIIGRAENRALVRYLNHPLQILTESDLNRSLPILFVDTQPGAGNNPVSLPPPPEVPQEPVEEGMRRVLVAGVIDRRPPLPSLAAFNPGFVDIRVDVGATSTILTDYLRAAEIELSTPLITALFYGIKTNTLGLGRNSGPLDADAYYYLQPRIDVEALAKIENAKVLPHYFKSFDLALRAAQVYELPPSAVGRAAGVPAERVGKTGASAEGGIRGDGVVISYVGPMNYPDLASEMADLLLRLEEARWVVCLGLFKDDLILSVRTRKRYYSAEALVQSIIGSMGTAGGHGTMAGGQIRLAGQEPQFLVEQLTAQILQHLNIPENTAGKPLI